MIGIARSAQEAARSLATLSPEAKNKALKSMALALIAKRGRIIRENKKDLGRAVKNKLPGAFIDRLALNKKRIEGMADALLELIKLPDPVGEVLKAWSRPNGLWIYKVRVPIGVIAVIYESRPNVTSDCVGLCFKSGNSLILRGGSEALHSNIAVYRALAEALKKHGVPQGAVSMISTPDRRAVNALLKLDNYIDLVMPRGGEGLIRAVSKVSRIPLIKHYKGICHVYVDDWADLNMAEEVCYNAKVQRPGVCNAMECMLVHSDVAVRFLPGMARRFKGAGVELRGCPTTRKIIKGIRRASDRDYRTEYLGLVLSVKVVGDLQEAIRHINHYGSRHSDAIITENYGHALEFLRGVDSAAVYVNASTRFTDGYEFGMGAEIGISTDKLHARGPVALEELTTYKYMVFGNGQVRE